jgi:hypothetical protein
METAQKVYETEFLALASYLKMKNIQMLGYDKRGDKVVFRFADQGDVCKKMQIEFLNSECKKFDSEVRDLKRLLKD